MQNLKCLLDQQAITVEDLSDKISVSARQIYRWLNNSSEIKAKNLITLADYFGCTTDELLDRENIISNPHYSSLGITPLENNLLQTFRKLSSDEQNKAIDILQTLTVKS